MVNLRPHNSPEYNIRLNMFSLSSLVESCSSQFGVTNTDCYSSLCSYRLICTSNLYNKVTLFWYTIYRSILYRYLHSKDNVVHNTMFTSYDLYERSSTEEVEPSQSLSPKIPNNRGIQTLISRQKKMKDTLWYPLSYRTRSRAR